MGLTEMYQEKLWHFGLQQDYVGQIFNLVFHSVNEKRQTHLNVHKEKFSFNLGMQLCIELIYRV